MNLLDKAIQKGYQLAVDGKEDSAFLMRDIPLFIVETTSDADDSQKDAGIGISDSAFIRFYYDPENHAVVAVGGKSARPLLADRGEDGVLYPKDGHIKNTHVIGARLLKEEQRGSKLVLTDGDIAFFRKKFDQYSGHLNHISHRHYTYHSAVDSETGAELYFSKRFGCVLMPTEKGFYDVYATLPVLREDGSHLRINQSKRGYFSHYKYKLASNMSLKDARASQKQFWDNLTHVIWSGQNVNEILPAFKKASFNASKAWNWLSERKGKMILTALGTSFVGAVFGKDIAKTAFLYLCAAHIVWDVSLDHGHEKLTAKLAGHKRMKELHNIRAFEGDNRDVTNFYRNIENPEDFRKGCVHPNKKITENNNGHYLPFDAVKGFAQDSTPFINGIDLMTLERAVVLARQRASTVQIQNLEQGVLMAHFAEGIRSLFHKKASGEIDFAVQDAPEFNTKEALRLFPEYQARLQAQRIITSSYKPRELDFAHITQDGKEILDPSELANQFEAVKGLSPYQQEIISASFDNEAWKERQAAAAYYGEPFFEDNPLPII